MLLVLNSNFLFHFESDCLTLYLSHGLLNIWTDIFFFALSYGEITKYGLQPLAVFGWNNGFSQKLQKLLFDTNYIDILKQNLFLIILKGM